MNINTIKNLISTIENCALLDEIKNYVDEQMQLNLNKKENFMYRDYIDNVLFAIYFKDGSRSVQCKGNKAYEIYINDDNAIRIESYTKDLFPTRELLLEK